VRKDNKASGIGSPNKQNSLIKMQQEEEKLKKLR
jgi:hypothetical protein